MSVLLDGFSMPLSGSSKIRRKNAPFMPTHRIARVVLGELYQSCARLQCNRRQWAASVPLTNREHRAKDDWRGLFGRDDMLALLNAFLRCYVCDAEPLLPMTSFGEPVCPTCMSVLQDSECSRPVFSSRNPPSSGHLLSDTCRGKSEMSGDS